MPERVPRTKYSAHHHWPLVRSETGLDVGPDTPEDERRSASRLFVGRDHWDYGFMWSILISANEFGEYRTRMGHAVYDQGGTDFRDDASGAFASAEEVLAFDPVEQLPNVPSAEITRRFEVHYRHLCHLYLRAYRSVWLGQAAP